MKHKAPEREFDLGPIDFRLVMDETTDGERVERERRLVEKDKQESNQRQLRMEAGFENASGPVLLVGRAENRDEDAEEWMRSIPDAIEMAKKCLQLPTEWTGAEIWANAPDWKCVAVINR